MTIRVYSLEAFLDVTYGLVTRGLKFTAEVTSDGTYHIELTGGF